MHLFTQTIITSTLWLLYMCYTIPVKGSSDSIITIRSIAPNDTNFSDLEKLSETLKGVKIIALGEQSHGDGASFDAKVRLIKYLHEKEGFNVLAFESGIYDCNKQNIFFKSNPYDSMGLFKAIFDIWHNQAIMNLSKYIGQTQYTPYPLTLIGIDCQFSGKYGRNDFVTDFMNMANYVKNKYDVALTSDSVRMAKILKWSVKYSNTLVKMKEEDTTLLWNSLNKLLDIPHQEDTIITFWQKIARNLIVDYRRKHLNTNQSINIRDSIMAQNLINCHQYSKEKIIVWAANRHIATDIPEYAKDKKRQFMGGIVKATLGDKYYALLFTSYEGKAKAGLINLKVTKAAPNSIEEYLRKLHKEYVFVNLKSDIKIPSEYLQKTKVFGHAIMNQDITKLADGILYIHQMYPSK